MSTAFLSRSMWSIRNLASNYLGSTIIVGIASFFRLTWIQNPSGMVFDEIYYVRDAYAFKIAGYELRWPGTDGPQQLSVDQPEFSVHPPLGKWVIALFMNIFGVNNPFGYRLGPVLCGIVLVIAVMIACLIVTRSILWSNFAGLLMAIDSLAISMSRVAMLDGIAVTFLVAGFVFFLLHYRARARGEKLRLSFSWLILAGLFFGLATATKWSALPFFGVFILIAIASEWGVFSDIKIQTAVLSMKNSIFIAFQTITMGLIAYVVSWFGWFTGRYSWGSYMSDYPTLQMPPALSWLPIDWHPFFLHHIEMIQSGFSANASHYATSPVWEWFLMLKPTMMAFHDFPQGETQCPLSNDCVLSWSTIANPFMWYPAVISILLLVWLTMTRRSVMFASVVAGLVAAFLPWFIAQRNEYFYYTIAALPFLVLSLILVLREYVSKGTRLRASEMFPRSIRAYLLLVVVGGLFFVPMALHAPMPDWFWNLHIWIPTWGEAAFEHLK